MIARAEESSASSWQRANEHRLNGEFHRIRLLLRRRALWLRHRWGEDPLREYRGLVISDARADALMTPAGREGEARFYREDPAAAAFSDEIARTERDDPDRTTAGDPAAIDRLAHLFGLMSFERDVLLLCLAVDTDPDVAQLCAYVQDDPTRQFATQHLAVALFGRDGNGDDPRREAFLPESPLRRFRILRFDGDGDNGTQARPIRLDERIAEYLLGANRLDERIGRLVRPLPHAPLAPTHRDVVDGVERRLRTLPRQGRWPLIGLVGAMGTGVRTVADAVCHRLGLHPTRVDPSRLPEPGPQLDDLIPLFEREAVLLQLAYVLDTRDAEDRVPSVTELASRLGVVALLISERPTNTGRDDAVTVAVPPLGPSEKAWVWREAIRTARHRFDGDIAGIVQQFDAGPAAVVEVIEAARGRIGATDGSISSDDLWAACRERAASPLSDLAQRVEPSFGWNDLVLPSDTLDQLREIAGQIEHRAQVFERWGFGAGLSRGRGLSALFSGPSGTGKTMAAEILAGHLRLDLYRIDLAGVVSKYIGETEKNLRRVFDGAEQSGSVLFFDEADALFGKRSEVRDSHDRYANIEIDYLLQRMEQYRGVAILATNQRSLLDPAFLRRLRFLVEFPFPDAELRLRIWERAFPPDAPIEDLDLDALARLEIAGANIKNIALAAAFLAAARGDRIRMEHALHAARREFAKIDRLPSDPLLGVGR